MGYIKAADLDELQPGQTKLVSNEGTEVVLCNVDGQYYAVDNFCPYMGAPL